MIAGSSQTCHSRQLVILAETCRVNNLPLTRLTVIRRAVPIHRRLESRQLVVLWNHLAVPDRLPTAYPVWTMSCLASKEVNFGGKISTKLSRLYQDPATSFTLDTNSSNVWKEVLEDPTILVGLDGVDWKELEKSFAQSPKKSGTKTSPRIKSKVERIQAAYSGDSMVLATCDRFVFELSQLPEYSTLVRALLLKEDFKTQAAWFMASLSNYVQVCKIILNSCALKTFLGRMLAIGNYINSGSYAGNAAGFRLKDLDKLAELRALEGTSHKNAQRCLLDFVVRNALETNPESLAFVDELNGLERANRLDLEQIRKAVCDLEIDVCDVQHLLSKKLLPALEAHVASFIAEACDEVDKLQKLIMEIDDISAKMALWFCEDPKRFSVSECIRIFHKLCSDVVSSKMAAIPTKV